MARSTNALEELAERLDRVGVELCRDELDADSKDAIRKAQRIVAELAKVDTVPDGNGKQKTACFEGCDAIDRCRAIAEEG